MGNNSTKPISDELGPNFPKNIHLLKLKNIGNTCYANSLIQALMNSTNVTNYLTEIHKELERHQLPEAIKDSPLCYLYKIFIIKSTAKQRDVLIEPKDFLESVIKQVPDFKIGIQHDSHEFFVYLLSSFDETIQKINSQYNTKFHSFSDLFIYHSITSQQCLMCGNISKTEEDFNCFYLSIKERNSLNSRLKQSQQPEYLQGEGKRFCNKCKIKQEMKIQCKYTKIPPVVVFQLQRFEFNRETCKMTKLHQHIPFPSAIDLNSKHYELKSVVVHIGASLSSGHFIAVLFIHEKWILASDSTLSVLDNHQVEEFFAVGEGKGPTSPSAYLLFYEQSVQKH